MRNYKLNASHKHIVDLKFKKYQVLNSVCIWYCTWVLIFSTLNHSKGLLKDVIFQCHAILDLNKDTHNNFGNE